MGLVIFDCDGVLVDCEAGSDAIVSGLLAEVGIQLSAVDVSRLSQGLSDKDMWKTFTRDFGVPIPAWVKARYRAQEDAFLRKSAHAVPGVEDVLNRLTDNRQAICVASSGTKAKMRVSLGVTGLARYFEHHVFSASQVRNGKPAPDLFLFAAQCMGVEPQHCAVIEDSLNGVRAGVAAGMTVFAFDPAGQGSELHAAGGTCFRAMAQLPGLLHGVVGP